ncbi:MAG TPA: MucR family transcriptional regulator [Xanthobacteraceae bacterium]|nr:MucR family transcriptional regulator [Xanthobacteraceae bacterium]
MPDTKTVDPLLVAQIVRNYVSYNGIPAGELANLIASVHRALAALGRPAEAAVSLKPAVAVNRSYGRDFVVCLECGWRGQMLRRHLATSHGLSPDDYRTRWNLTATYPLTAPAYAERRSAIAKELGLGRSPQLTAAPVVASTRAELDPAFVASLSQPKRRGRPRGTALTATTP